MKLPTALFIANKKKPCEKTIVSLLVATSNEQLWKVFTCPIIFVSILVNIQRKVVITMESSLILLITITILPELFLEKIKEHQVFQASLSSME